MAILPFNTPASIQMSVVLNVSNNGIVIITRTVAIKSALPREAVRSAVKRGGKGEGKRKKINVK